MYKAYPSNNGVFKEGMLIVRVVPVNATKKKTCELAKLIADHLNNKEKENV